MLCNYLKEYLTKRIEQLKKHKPKSYSNKLRKEECYYLLNVIKKYEGKLEDILKENET